jgi:hypothetical protein
MLKHVLLYVVIILLVSDALAADPSPRRPREFSLAELEDRKSGPNAFQNQHVARQAWPGNVEKAAHLQAGGRAKSSFKKIQSSTFSQKQSGTWQTVGPVSLTDNGIWELWQPKNSSGRVTDLAIGNSCNSARCRLYAGTAGGGLWRTDRALHPDDQDWQYLSDGLPSNNIGTVTLDPNDTTGMTLYVGTGESNFNYSSAAGVGVFKSTNGGDRFTRVPTMYDGLDFTVTRGISQIAIEPGDPDTIFVATTTAMMGMTSVRGGQSTITGQPQASVGLYLTSDGGVSWILLFEAPINTLSSPGTPEGMYEIISGVKDVQLDPLDPKTVFISVADDGIYRSSPALDGDSDFHHVFQIVTSLGQRSDSYAAFDLTVKDGKTRVYLYNGNGWDYDYQVLYRLDDASVAHNVLFADGENQSTWVNLTKPLILPADYVDFSICNGQCVYDLVVAVPDGQPDTVYLGGQLSRYLGDPAMRSTNGGNSFNSLTIDRQIPPGMPHVDVRTIVFSPENPEIAFIGSDGGVVRTDGQYGQGSYHCTATVGFTSFSFLGKLCQTAWAKVPVEFVFMNRGLQTMQLYNISADPNRPLERQMAGTQDNSTQWNEGTLSIFDWTKVFNIGDGTSANGFHPTDPSILFASFQSNWFFTHFNGGIGGADSWAITSWPIQDSGEATDPIGPTGRQFLTFDPLVPDTQYTGYEHVWRTRNNGGDRAYLEANCTYGGGTYGPGCGDWEPLGDFLTRDVFGDNRTGGVIVAGERSTADAGTLWAATSLGRVFITQNVDAPAAAVSFDRVDSINTPPRFISGIAVDHENPRRAFVSYSGFDAVTPDAPGHVFEVVYDGVDAVFTSIDYNLGDMPINHLVRDDLTGDLYAATDFGVLVLPNRTKAWGLAGQELPAVLTPHLEIHPQQRILFAATHGMGAWYLELRSGKVKHCLQDSKATIEKAAQPIKCPRLPPSIMRDKDRRDPVRRRRVSAATPSAAFEHDLVHISQ